jgi:hypothetical protein
MWYKLQSVSLLKAALGDSRWKLLGSPNTAGYLKEAVCLGCQLGDYSPTLESRATEEVTEGKKQEAEAAVKVQGIGILLPSPNDQVEALELLRPHLLGLRGAELARLARCLGASGARQCLLPMTWVTSFCAALSYPAAPAAAVHNSMSGTASSGVLEDYGSSNSGSMTSAVPLSPLITVMHSLTLQQLLHVVRLVDSCPGVKAPSCQASLPAFCSALVSTLSAQVLQSASIHAPQSRGSTSSSSVAAREDALVKESMIVLELLDLTLLGRLQCEPSVR